MENALIHFKRCTPAFLGQRRTQLQSPAPLREGSQHPTAAVHIVL